MASLDLIILIIKAIAWPFVVLTVVALFLFLFKKQIANRLKQLKKADVRKGFLEFGESPIDISTQQDLSTKKVEPASAKPKDTINWNKSGALYWLGHDLMWTVDVLLRGGPRDIITHGLRQSLLHLQEVGFAGSHMESRLKQIFNEAKSSHEKDWTQARRNWATTELSSIIRSIGKLAVDNQPGFKHSLTFNRICTGSATLVTHLVRK